MYRYHVNNVAHLHCWETMADPADPSCVGVLLRYRFPFLFIHIHSTALYILFQLMYRVPKLAAESSSNLVQRYENEATRATL